MTQVRHFDELKHRVEAKRRRLQAQIAEAKADASARANETLRSMEANLEELDDHLRGGWDNLTEAALQKINAWLRDDKP